MAMLLRKMLGMLVIVGLWLGVACASGATPTPTTAPTKPSATTAPAAKSAGTDSAAAKPAAPAEPKAAASSDWKAEWDKTVEAAKKEGKVVLAGPRGQGFREANLLFEKAFPGIKVEYTGGSGSDTGPKVLAERAGGLYLWDLHIGGPTTFLQTLKPNGVLDPLKPALILPEVLEDNNWRGGFNAHFMDKEGQYVYAFLGYLSFAADVNRDVAPESELKSVDQLIDPKWKGKIAMQDPRRAGAGSAYNGYLVLVKGEDWFRKLMANVQVSNDPRLMLQGLIRGQYAVAMGTTEADTQEFEGAGLMKSIKPLDPYSELGGRLTSGSGTLALINKAPHPNAAKVFANWLLSKEGQKAYADVMHLNSRRVDVEGPADVAPRPGIKYLEIHREVNLPMIDKSIEIAKDVLK